jgi:hypothetical protein
VECTEHCSLLQPREALLKYADVAEKDPQWTGGKLVADFVAVRRRTELDRGLGLNWFVCGCARQILRGCHVVCLVHFLIWAASVASKPTEACFCKGGGRRRGGKGGAVVGRASSVGLRGYLYREIINI